MPSERDGAGFGPDGPELFGEGLGEERVFGPAGDEVDLHAFGGGHDGAAVEADAGAGVLRGEADGFEFADAFGAHLGDDVGDVWDASCACRRRREPRWLLRGAGLAEGPLGEGWGFGAAGFGEADLGVAVLEFFDDLGGEGAASGDFAEVFGHLAEDVGGAVGEEEDGVVGGVVALAEDVGGFGGC